MRRASAGRPHRGGQGAARPSRPLTELRAALVEARTRLDSLEYADLAVRTSFSVGLRDEPDAPLFGLLGALDARTYTPGVAAALLDCDEAEAAAALRRLADARLIDRVAPHRYAMHDLLRLYARELAPSDARAALGRTAHGYLATVAEGRQQPVDPLPVAGAAGGVDEVRPARHRAVPAPRPART
ncbi:hypothetical protein [Nonomuraea recticatena]|uniref:hypothetical protein n=1 Tax=Nonomuraea recticatena TaxID=46178 RepID=UPI0036088D69